MTYVLNERRVSEQYSVVRAKQVLLTRNDMLPLLKWKQEMKVHFSLVLLCTLAASSCGETSPMSIGADANTSGDSKSILLPETELVAGHIRDSPPKSVSSPNEPREVVLRRSYYDCVQDNNGSTWDMQACIEKEAVYQDGRLNVAYRELRSKMGDRARRRFKAEERQWLSGRAVSCEWNAKLDGQAQRIDANVCSLKMTAARVSELERRGERSGL